MPLHAKIQECIGFSVENVPHFCFAGFTFHTPGILIVRVHLNGQRLFRVNELDQDREPLHIPAFGPQDFPALVFDVLGQCLAGVVTGDHFALTVLVCGQFPGLGKRIHVRLFIVKFFQLGPAPDVVFAGRMQFYNCHVCVPRFCTHYRLHRGKSGRQNERIYIFHICKDNMANQTLLSD